MQVVLVKRIEDVKEGEKLVVANAEGRLIARKVLSLNEPHRGHVSIDGGTAECDIDAIVLILGEWFS